MAVLESDKLNDVLSASLRQAKNQVVDDTLTWQALDDGTIGRHLAKRLVMSLCDPFLLHFLHGKASDREVNLLKSLHELLDSVLDGLLKLLFTLGLLSCLVHSLCEAFDLANLRVIRKEGLLVMLSIDQTFFVKLLVLHKILLTKLIEISEEFQLGEGWSLRCLLHDLEHALPE